MLSKPESTASVENFPVNPGILELSSWVGKHASFYKFQSGRAMNYNPETVKLEIFTYEILTLLM